MNSTALIVSDDLILRSEARTCLGAMRADCICVGLLGFRRFIESKKAEAIVLDIPECSGAVSALKEIRAGKLNRYSIVMALVDDGPSASDLWRAGANFTIRRSGSIREELTKAFQSAHGLILREKRRFERHPVDLEVEILANGRRASARMVDISERGACLECAFPLPKTPVQLKFCLPGLKQYLKGEGIPAWVHGTKVGIQFTSVPEASQAALSEWLVNRMTTQDVRNLVVT